MPIPDLDLCLAYDFRDWPWVWSQLSARGVELAAAELAFRRIEASFRDTIARSGRGPLGWTPDAAAAVYGPPRERRGDRLYWDLALWPEHEFVCEIRWEGDGEPGIVVGNDIRLRAEDAISVPTPLTFDGAAAAFRVGHHSSVDVRRALGRPAYVKWRDPAPSVLYVLDDRSTLRFRTVHGLIADISRLPHLRELAEAERRPGVSTWWAVCRILGA